MTQFQLNDTVKSAFGELCKVNEVSECGKYVGLVRESDGATIGSDASIVEFVSRFVGFDDEGFATYFLGFQL